MTKQTYNGVDAFVPGIGTVRECIDCGALIAGGPTRCKRCAVEGAPKDKDLETSKTPEEYMRRLDVLQRELKYQLRKYDLELNADLEHEIWSSWMRYMFSKGEMNADGSWTMPAWAVERWQRQMNTPYSQLSEKEKEGDRDQVRKHWEVWETGQVDRSEGTEGNQGGQ